METAGKIAIRIEWLARNQNPITTTLIDRETEMRTAAAECIAAALATVEQETREAERERCAQALEFLAGLVQQRAGEKDSHTTSYIATAIDALREGASSLRSHGGETR
jgi:hypothetical protein